MRLNPEYTEPDNGQYDRQAQQYARNNPVRGLRVRSAGTAGTGLGLRRNPESRALSASSGTESNSQTLCLQSSPTWSVQAFLERLQKMPHEKAVQYLKETYPGVPGYVRDKLLRCEYRTQGGDVYVGL